MATYLADILPDSTPGSGIPTSSRPINVTVPGTYTIAVEMAERMPSSFSDIGSPWATIKRGSGITIYEVKLVGTQVVTTVIMTEDASECLVGVGCTLEDGVQKREVNVPIVPTNLEGVT